MIRVLIKEINSEVLSGKGISVNLLEKTVVRVIKHLYDIESSVTFDYTQEQIKSLTRHNLEVHIDLGTIHTVSDKSWMVSKMGGYLRDQIRGLHTFPFSVSTGNYDEGIALWESVS